MLKKWTTFEYRYNVYHYISLSKSKCWYSNNCLHFFTPLGSIKIYQKFTGEVRGVQTNLQMKLKQKPFFCRNDKQCQVVIIPLKTAKKLFLASKKELFKLFWNNFKATFHFFSSNRFSGEIMERKMLIKISFGDGELCPNLNVSE